MGTTANPVSNAPSGGVYANVDNTGKPLTEEEYRQLEKRLAQEGQNGMLEQLYGDKNEKRRNGGASKIEDSGSKGNGGEKEPADNKSSVFYPSSSPYHRANSKNSAQSTKARTSSAGTTNLQMPQGDRGPTSGSWYDRVGPIGVVAAIIFILVLLVLLIWIATKATAIEEGIEAIKEEIEAIKCQLKHIKRQLKTCDDCLVQKVVTNITTDNTG